jgi:hypothetical protein
MSSSRLGVVLPGRETHDDHRAGEVAGGDGARHRRGPGGHIAGRVDPGHARLVLRIEGQPLGAQRVRRRKGHTQPPSQSERWCRWVATSIPRLTRSSPSSKRTASSDRACPRSSALTAGTSASLLQRQGAARPGLVALLGSFQTVSRLEARACRRFRSWPLAGGVGPSKRCACWDARSSQAATGHAVAVAAEQRSCRHGRRDALTVPVGRLPCSRSRRGVHRPRQLVGSLATAKRSASARPTTPREHEGKPAAVRVPSTRWVCCGW